MPRSFLIAVGGIGIINFVSFFIVAVIIGGDALNGCSHNGRYFLGSHGRYTETTKAIFTYSRVHAYTLFVTHPAAMLAGLLLSRKKQKSVAFKER